MSTSPDVRHKRRRSGEFVVYFTIIFIAALPFAAIEWVCDVFRRSTLNVPGPLARAWLEADRITPVIFSN
ncbi:MAG: cytochrome PufQ [Pseudoprimorskyibacter sp.]|jgi:hypothetical protein|nr:cytochrome PufQ [Pseudoprimorskyibacter sp.]